MSRFSPRGAAMVSTSWRWRRAGRRGPIDMAGHTRAAVGIEGASYRLPAKTLTLEELGDRGALRSPPEVLASFGFRQVHVAERESHFDMALQAAREVLCETGADPQDVDLLLFAGGLTSSSTMIRAPAPEGAALHM